MIQRFFVLLFSLLSLFPLRSLGDEEGVLIVQLSLLATVGKCSQVAIEFQPEEWAALSNQVWHGETASRLPRTERVRLWMIGRSMLGQINAETCARTRRQIGTWLPSPEGNRGD